MSAATKSKQQQAVQFAYVASIKEDYTRTVWCSINKLYVHLIGPAL
jgi:hypothetical protein